MLPIDLTQVVEGRTEKGLLYVTDYTKKLDPASRAPLYGTAHYRGKSMGFKIWDARYQNIFNTNDLTRSIIEVIADVGVYKENVELTLKEINFNHGFTDVTVFYKSVDIDGVFGEFTSFVNTNLSQEAIIVLSTIFKNEDLYGKFKITWAAMKMHDAQVGGLMNHTVKMLKLAKALIENDSRLAQWSDLIYLSIIFHDIGKVLELEEGGAYTKNSFVGHRTLGVEILVRQRDIVVQQFNEAFYYHILEVITGHHGADYGDAPKTVWAYIVHLIDMLDSQVTGFLDRISNGELKERNGNSAIWYNGSYLIV